MSLAPFSYQTYFPTPINFAQLVLSLFHCEFIVVNKKAQRNTLRYIKQVRQARRFIKTYKEVNTSILGDIVRQHVWSMSLSRWHPTLDTSMLGGNQSDMLSQLLSLLILLEFASFCFFSSILGSNKLFHSTSTQPNTYGNN